MPRLRPLLLRLQEPRHMLLIRSLPMRLRRPEVCGWCRAREHCWQPRQLGEFTSGQEHAPGQSNACCWRCYVACVLSLLGAELLSLDPGSAGQAGRLNASAGVFAVRTDEEWQARVQTRCRQVGRQPVLHGSPTRSRGQVAPVLNPCPVLGLESAGSPTRVTTAASATDAAAPRSQGTVNPPV